VKIAVVFFSPAKSPNVLATQMVNALSKAGHAVELVSVKAIKESDSKRFFGLHKKQQLKLVSTKTDLSEFDFVLFGSTAEGMMPKRKLPPEMELYLKECRGIENKRAGVFVATFGFAGTTPQKMNSLLHMRGVEIFGTKVFSFLLHFSPEQLKEAEQFALESVK